MLQDEVYSDSIIPFLKKELKRKVDISGRVTIKGGIYCQNLEIDAGDIFIQKSVFTEEGILIKGKKGGMVWFNSPVACNHSILVEERGEMLVRFGKTIKSSSINLYNTIVYGNVIGDSIILKNSVVLGGVFCKNKLTIDNSIVGTYHCNELIHHNNMGILFPMAISDKQPELSENVFMVIPGSFSNGNPGALYKLGKEDFYPLFKNGEKQYVFSNTLKIFDIRSYYLNLQENIERLFDATTRIFESTDNVKDTYLEFDNKYFEIIRSNFKQLSNKGVWSDFMSVENEIVKEYFDSYRSAENIDVKYNISNSASSAEILAEPVDSKLESTSEENIIIKEQTKIDTLKVDADLICPNCKDDVKDGGLFCENCGEKLNFEKNEVEDIANQSNDNAVDLNIEKIQENENQKNADLSCPNCGDDVIEDASFCENCGEKIYPESQLNESLEKEQNDELDDFLEEDEDSSENKLDPEDRNNLSCINCGAIRLGGSTSLYCTECGHRYITNY